MPQTRVGASRRPQRAVRRPRIQQVSRPYAGACEEKEGEQAAAPGKNAAFLRSADIPIQRQY